MANTHHDLQAAAVRAITAAGGTVAMARALGASKQAVSNWRRTRIPAERLPRVEALTGIPAADLRPDIHAPRAEAA